MADNGALRATPAATGSEKMSSGAKEGFFLHKKFINLTIGSFQNCEEGKNMLPKHLVKTMLVSMVALGLGAGALALFAQETPPPAPQANNIVLRPIPTAVAHTLDNERLRVFPGTVRARRRVQLGFSVPGLLRTLNAREGRVIQKGEILARLDQRDFKHALDAARAKCSYAEHELERFRRLLAKNVATQGDYENVQTAYEVALAELRTREKALADTELPAPFEGVVVSRNVENYEHVQAKQPILSFQDISTIEVVIQIPERLIAREGVSGFRNLLVHFDADVEPQRWLQARVREYSAESDPVTRSYEVVVSLARPENVMVYPGMTASVKARMPAREQAARPDAATFVPVEALWQGPDGKQYVWVIDPQGGNPRKQEVEATVLTGDSVKILKGLRAGTHVAVAGVHTLREESLVRPMAAGKEGLDG